jgi:hypothetical protein
VEPNRLPYPNTKKDIVMRKIKLALIASAIFAANAFAVDVDFEDQCNVELNYDLTITPKHILIKDNDETIADIYNNNVLFIRGEQVDLNDMQTKWLTDYSTSLRTSVPEVAEIAVEAVEVAFEGINSALGRFSDMSSTRVKFDELKDRINQKFNEQEGYYSFKNGNFTSDIDDETIDDMVEEIVEDMVPSIIGNLLANIGTAIASGETSFEELDNLDEEIEAAIEERVEVIEVKAQRFCDKLKRVDDIEASLVASNNKLIYLDLISIQQHKSNKL